MRIEIIDQIGMNHTITSSDPETIGRWMIETYAKIQYDHRWSDPRVMVWPGWGRDGEADWICDSRVLGQSLVAKSPREVLDAMAAQLDELEKLQQVP